MAFAPVTASLMLNTADFSAKLAQAGARMRTFASGLSDGYKNANMMLSKHTLGLKDTARIVQGIVISQVFYAAAGAIRDATSALTQFNEKLDYANVTYSALFGSADIANDFVKVLQEKSVNSIFDYETLADASKKMLAYGIQYENLGFILDGLMNLGAMSGDAAALDRIALALGQIQTKGKLSAEEMRQLANAYVPIYDIVKDGFNLTPEQMSRVGDLQLPAHQVINAIVDYANEKFGSVGDAAMYTITGLKNRVVDTMKVLGSQMMMPLTNAWKSFLKYAADGLQGIRDAFAAGGWGGVFEKLVPDPATQTVVRAFLANVHNGIMTLIRVISSVSSIVGEMGRAFMIAFNIVAPVVNTAITVLATFLKVISDNAAMMGVLRVATVIAAGAFIVLKAQALGALVIGVVTKVVNGLSKALIVLSTLITKHPIIMMVAGLAIALTGVAAASNNAENGLSSFFKTLSGIGGGLTQEDIFKKTEQDIEDAYNAADQFNNRLTDGAKDLEEGLNGANKAAKKAKGLLSFDEVFKLPDQSSNSGVGDYSGLGADMEGLMTGLGALGDALIPEIPDFGEFSDNFANALFGDLYASISRIANAGLSGGLIGALAGFAIGGLITKSMSGALAGAKLGMKIGAYAGAGFATFWGDTYAELEKTIQNIAVGAGAGTLLGGLTGLLIGAFATRSMAGAMEGARIGASIGMLAGGAIGGIFDQFGAELEARIGAIAWGGAEGMLIGGLAGMMLGAFATKSLSGALTGARFGAAIGGVIGGAMGGIMNDAEAGIGSALENMFSHISAASWGSMIGAFAGLIIGAIIGAFAGGIGALPGARLGATLGATLGGLGGMLVSYLNTSGIAESIGEWFAKVGQSIGDFFRYIGDGISIAWHSFIDTWSNIFNEIGNVFRDTVNGVKESFAETITNIKLGFEALKNSAAIAWNSFTSMLSNTWTSIVNWFNNLINSITTWLVNLWNSVWGWLTNAWNSVTTWLANLWDSIWGWLTNAWNSAISWLSKLWNSVWGWLTNAFNSVLSWYIGLWTTIFDRLATAATSVGKWFSDLWSTIWGWLTNTFNKVTSWYVGLWKAVINWLATAATNIANWFSKLWTSISSWFTNIGTDIKNWWNGLFDAKKWKAGWESVKDWFSDLWDSISGWFTGLARSVTNWWNNLWKGKKASVSVEGEVTGSASGSLSGHATGGIFNREHIARFAEGNKAEAVIPLENASAMRPFVDAISRGIIEGIAPTLVQTGGGSDNLPPMYVGTLIADERGLKQLYKKFELIQVQENARRGITTT